MFKTLIGGVAAALIAGAASAATFSASFYKVTGDTGNFELAEAIDGVTSGNLQATFRSTVINYPRGGSDPDTNSTGTKLGGFLNDDAGTLSFLGTAPSTGYDLNDSVFVFTGLVDLTGVDDLIVGSDDGFRLTLNGVVEGSAGRRSFNETAIDVSALTGLASLELLYFEDSGNTGVTFEARRTGATQREFVQAAAVPLPAAAPMLLAGFAGLAALRRRRDQRSRRTRAADRTRAAPTRRGSDAFPMEIRRLSDPGPMVARFRG